MYPSGLELVCDKKVSHLSSSCIISCLLSPSHSLSHSLQFIYLLSDEFLSLPLQQDTSMVWEGLGGIWPPCEPWDRVRERERDPSME